MTAQAPGYEHPVPIISGDESRSFSLVTKKSHIDLDFKYGNRMEKYTKSYEGVLCRTENKNQNYINK